MPTLKEQIQAAATAALGAVESLASPATYRTYTGGGIDTSTGDWTDPTPVDTPITVLFAGFSLREQTTMQGYEAGDMKGIVGRGAFPALQPKVEDEVIDQNGEVWRVLGVETDPAEVLWVLWLRRKDTL